MKSAQVVFEKSTAAILGLTLFSQLALADLQRAHFDLHLHLTQKYPSMTGPTDQINIDMEKSFKNKAIWITGFRVDVLDDHGKPQNLDYLCHAWATIPTESSSGFLTISQGLNQMNFPAGFGLKGLAGANSKISLLVQGLNNYEENLNKNLTYRFTFEYLTEAEGQQKGLKALKSFALSTLVKNTGQESPGMAMNMPMHHHHHSETTDGYEEHFMVPPGRHIFKYDIPATKSFKESAHIHFIKMHLHPFGESVELFDQTTHQTVWKGNAQAAADRMALEKTDSYSSAQGLSVSKDHKYQIISTYNNTTTQPIDAMGVLRLYLR